MMVKDVGNDVPDEGGRDVREIKEVFLMIVAAGGPVRTVRWCPSSCPGISVSEVGASTCPLHQDSPGTVTAHAATHATTHFLPSRGGRGG